MSEPRDAPDLDVQPLPRWEDDELDDLLVQTPEFQAMIARSRASLESEPTVPGEVLLQEALEALAREEGVDELLVQTPEFQAMMARSRASLENEGPVPLDDLLEEFRDELALYARRQPADGDEEEAADRMARQQAAEKLNRQVSSS